ncbi:hypothetical protein, partial [Aeromonas rivipollensis]|uniref:hypothetical protein n=1 Tax=Aeromonas rivipollensis TaxID=948519 RepID=UPI00259EF989
ERSSGSTYDLGNVSDSGSLSRYSKSTVRRHRRVSHFEVEFALNQVLAEILVCGARATATISVKLNQELAEIPDV